jgi:hypothetical protein
MGYGNYQNGGLWDWWGGVQIKAEFQTGFAEAGYAHLLQVANDWQKHPGNIIEWHSTTDQRHEGSHYYSAAAGTMGSAIIEGLFGVELNGNGFTLQPRLGLNDGFIRVYQAATDHYAAYSYDWDQDVIKIDYGTNVKGIVTVKVLKLRSEHISEVTIDGHPVDFEAETIGRDTYTVFMAPTGQHRLEIIKGQPLAQTAAVEVPASAAQDTSPKLPLPTPNVAPNLVAVSERDAQETGTSARSSEATSASAKEVAGDRSEQANGEQTSTLSAAESIAVRNARETRLAILRFISAGLIMLTCLTIMVLVVIRRVVGLSHQQSSAVHPYAPARKTGARVQHGSRYAPTRRIPPPTSS